MNFNLFIFFLKVEFSRQNSRQKFEVNKNKFRAIRTNFEFPAQIIRWISKMLFEFSRQNSYLPFRTWTLICLASEFEGIHWKTPLWDLLTRCISRELTVTPGRQFWLKINLTLASFCECSDTSTNWKSKTIFEFSRQNAYV